MNRVIVLPQVAFDELCKQNNWNDDNVENLNNCAFISICGTEDLSDYQNVQIGDNTEHWFKSNHSNVLNLEFDDVLSDLIIGGFEVKALNSQQAVEIVNFIDKNKGKDFFIHCLAGLSRSGAVGTFIAENYDEYKGALKYATYLRPNSHVLAELNRILWERHFENFNLED